MKQFLQFLPFQDKFYLYPLLCHNQKNQYKKKVIHYTKNPEEFFHISFYSWSLYDWLIISPLFSSHFILQYIWAYHNKLDYLKIYNNQGKEINKKNMELMTYYNNSNYTLKKNPRCYRGAIQNGNLYTVIWLKNNKYPFNEFTIAEACLYNKIDIVKWFVNNGCPINIFSFDYAAKYGNIEILMWLKNMNPDLWDSFKCYATNSIDILHLLYQYPFKINVVHCYNYAVRIKNAGIMKWFYSHFQNEFTSYILIDAAKIKDISLIQWCIENGIEWSPVVAEIACKNDGIEILRWMREYFRENWLDMWNYRACMEKYGEKVEKWIMELG
jgi:hypothetical protein